jgi:hypothetical protein
LGVQAASERVIVLRMVRSLWAAALSAAFFGVPAVLQDLRVPGGALAAYSA